MLNLIYVGCIIRITQLNNVPFLPKFYQSSKKEIQHKMGRYLLCFLLPLPKVGSGEGRTGPKNYKA